MKFLSKKQGYILNLDSSQLKKLPRRFKIPPGSTVVCTLTGHGLKDSDVTIAHSGAPVLTVKAHKDAVRSAIAGGLE